MPAGRPSRDSIYRRLDDAIADLQNRLGGMPSPAEAEDIWDSIWHQEAHHSTAIEGNTLVLKEVRKLLAEGRAVGNKDLKEYMEVEGYAKAARWVYSQAHGNGWTTGSLITVHEVRSVHHEAMSLVWEVAPHPHALPEESPGNWRRHEIREFSDGMKPPPFTELKQSGRRLGPLREPAHQTRSRRTVSRAAGSEPQRVRTSPPVPRRKRPRRTPAAQPAPRPARLPAGDHLQARASAVSDGDAESGHRRIRTFGRTTCAGHHRQPAPLCRPRRSRTGPTRAAGQSRRAEVPGFGERVTHGGGARPASRAEATRWHVDVHPQLGGRVHQRPLPARMTRPRRSRERSTSSARVRLPPLVLWPAADGRSDGAERRWPTDRAGDRQPSVPAFVAPADDRCHHELGRGGEVVEVGRRDSERIAELRDQRAELINPLAGVARSGKDVSVGDQQPPTVPIGRRGPVPKRGGDKPPSTTSGMGPRALISTGWSHQPHRTC